MGGTDVSRRSFLKGVGFAGLSAGTFGAFGAAGVAFADDASAGEAQSDMYRRLASSASRRCRRAAVASSASVP